MLKGSGLFIQQTDVLLCGVLTMLLACVFSFVSIADYPASVLALIILRLLTRFSVSKGDLEACKICKAIPLIRQVRVCQ